MNLEPKQPKLTLSCLHISQDRLWNVDFVRVMQAGCEAGRCGGGAM